MGSKRFDDGTYETNFPPNMFQPLQKFCAWQYIACLNKMVFVTDHFYIADCILVVVRVFAFVFGLATFKYIDASDIIYEKQKDG